MKKANNVIRIPTSLEGKFFSYWLQFLKPFHGLTNMEIKVSASFLRHRYELGKVIKDANILDKVVMGEDIKRKVREECGVTPPYFQVILSKMRKRKIIVDGKLNPRFIPNIEEGSGSFQLMLLFELA